MPALEPATIAPGPLLDAGRSQLLVIDVQRGLVEAMPPATRARALAGLELLAHAAGALGVPTTVTEHLPARLGRTDPQDPDSYPLPPQVPGVGPTAAVAAFILLCLAAGIRLRARTS